MRKRKIFSNDSILVDKKLKIYRRYYAHPFKWSYGIILVLFLFQIALGCIFFFYLNFYRGYKSNQYFEVVLNSQLNFMKNLKLAGLDNYIWKMALDCKTLLSSDEQEKKQPILKKKCLKMDIKFMPSSQVKLEKKYYTDKQKKYFLYNEKIDEPCLICHFNQKGSYVNWKFMKDSDQNNSFTSTFVPTILPTLSEREFRYKFILYYLLIIFSLWIIYFLVRKFLKINGQLDVVSLVLLRYFPAFSMEFLEYIHFFKNKFLYLEIGENYIRGYLLDSVFRKWLCQIFSAQITGIESMFLNIHGCSLKTSDHFGYEALRVSQLLAAKSKNSEILIDKDIIDSIKKVNLPVKSRRLIWKLKNQKREKRFQFVDFSFDH